MKQFNLKNMGRRTILAALVALLGVGNAMAAAGDANNIGGSSTGVIDLNSGTYTGDAKVESDGNIGYIDNNNTALFKLNNATAQAYTLSFLAAVNQNNNTIKAEILSAADAETAEWTYTFNLRNNGSTSGYAWYGHTTASVATGEKYLRLTFLGTKYICNLKDLKLIPANAGKPTGALEIPGTENAAVTLSPDNTTPRIAFSGSVKEVSGVQTFDSFGGGGVAAYNLYNSTAQRYTISFKGATKEDGARLGIELNYGDNKQEYNEKDITKAGNWTTFNDYSFVTTESLPVGNIVLNMFFKNVNVSDLTFTPVVKTIYSVSASANSAAAGSVSGAGNYEDGTSVTLTATPNYGYKFVNWTEGSTEVSTAASYTFTASKNVTLVANFEAVDMHQAIPGSLDITKAEVHKGNLRSGDNYWENNRNGHSITYQLRAASAACYQIQAGIGTNQTGVTINATVKNSSDEIFLNETLDVTNNGSFDNFDTKYKWGCALPAGDYSLTFTTYVAGSGYTLNMKDVTVSTVDNVTCTIPSSGVGTFCSEYPLDFTGTGVDAYIITGDITEGKIEATPVSGVVPARTGIIVKGTAGAHSINVSAAATAKVDGNELVGVTVATVVDPTGDTGNSYYVMKDGALHPVTTSGTISANHAYLKIAEGGSAPLFLIFGDETTGINKVVLPTSNDGVFYDLQGRRVAQPTKGLYIVNGKKVIMK